MITKEDNTPADRVLNRIEYRSRIGSDKVERQVLKEVILSAGVTTLSNKTNEEYFIKK